MSTPYPTRDPAGLPGANTAYESAVSAASWPAIFAGALAAAATSLILVALGTGIDLASVSPWPNSGVSATTFTVMTAIWLVVVQWLSALIGGYLTGRLRSKWVNVHTHEVFFRDTANGFVAWALSTVIGAVLLASAVGGTATKALQAASAAGRAEARSSDAIAPYDLDRLLRPNSLEGAPARNDGRAEVTRILLKATTSSPADAGLSAEDHDYLVKLVAARTGIPESAAQKRVDETIANARQAADTARKATSTASIFMALSLIIGAFIASASAALGGRLRDLHP